MRGSIRTARNDSVTKTPGCLKYLPHPRLLRAELPYRAIFVWVYQNQVAKGRKLTTWTTAQPDDLTDGYNAINPSSTGFDNFRRNPGPEDPKQASSFSQTEQQEVINSSADYTTFNRGLELCDCMTKQAVETHVALTDVDQTRAVFLDFWCQLGWGLTTALVKGRLPSLIRTSIQLREQMKIVTEEVPYSGVYGQLIVDKDGQGANSEQLRRGLNALELYLQGDKPVVEKTTTASMHKHQVYVNQRHLKDYKDPSPIQARIQTVKQFIKDGRVMLAKFAARKDDTVRTKPFVNSAGRHA